MTSTDPFKSGFASAQERISIAEERRREAEQINEREKSRLLSLKRKLEAYPELKDYSVTVSDGRVSMLGDHIYHRDTHGPILSVQFRKMETISPLWRDDGTFFTSAHSGGYNEDGAYSPTSDEDILMSIGTGIGHLKKYVDDRRIVQTPLNIYSYWPWISVGILIILLILWNQ